MALYLIKVCTFCGKHPEVWVQGWKTSGLFICLEHAHSLCPALTCEQPRSQALSSSISIVFCVLSVIRHGSSLSKYRKQKQSPPPGRVPF
jgi:hypothetical protein